MNLKKLNKNVVTVKHYLVLAVVGGLAAGAAIALLFPSQSGRESIKLLLKKIQKKKHTPTNELEEQLLEEVRKATLVRINRLPRQAKNNDSPRKGNSYRTVLPEKQAKHD